MVLDTAAGHAPRGHHHPEQHVALLGLDKSDGPTIGVEPGSEHVIIEAYVPEDGEDTRERRS